MPWLHNMSLKLSSHVSALVRSCSTSLLGYSSLSFSQFADSTKNNPAKGIFMKVEETVDEVTKINS